MTISTTHSATSQSGFGTVREFLKALSALSLRLAALAVCLSLPAASGSTNSTAAVAPTSVTTQALQVSQEREVGELALRAMDAVRSPLTRVRRMMMARLVSRTAMEILTTQEERRSWVVLLAIESKFNGMETSPTGAVGLGQLIPHYAKDFGSPCGLEGVVETDLRDDATNAVLSACYFKSLINAFKGNVALALVAYNAGPHSEDLKNFQNLSNISNEPANYVSRFALLREQLEGKDE